MFIYVCVSSYRGGVDSEAGAEARAEAGARDDEGPKEALETTEWAEKLGWNPELRGTPLGSGYRHPFWELPVGPGNCQLNRQAPSGV